MFAARVLQYVAAVVVQRLGSGKLVQIITNGLWSVMMVNALPYKYVWYR